VLEAVRAWLKPIYHTWFADAPHEPWPKTWYFKFSNRILSHYRIRANISNSHS